MERLSLACLLAFLLLPVSSAAASGAGNLLVQATITLGEETIASPRLVVEAGKNFSVTTGKKGEQQVSLSGMAAPINDRNVATDFTLELEQPAKAGAEIRRVSQTVKTAYGEAYYISGIKDINGRELKMVLTVGHAPD